MRLQPTVRILRGPIDAAPVLGVLFLLLMFVLLSSQYVFVPGVPIHLPKGEGMEKIGVSGPTVAVVVDYASRIYFDNQVVQDRALAAKLSLAVKRSAEPVTLVVLADRAAKYEDVVKLAQLAKEAGMKDTVWGIHDRPLLQSIPTPKR
jgi:biopolymer transport protein ExbD